MHKRISSGEQDEKLERDQRIKVIEDAKSILNRQAKVALFFSTGKQMNPFLLGLLFGIWLISSNAIASQGSSSICYGDGYTMMVTAPKGWVTDNHSGKPNGICSVLYPVGGSWEKSAAVMYPNSFKKEGGNLKKAIELDLEQFRKRYPTMTVSDSKNQIQYSSGSNAKVKHIEASQSNSYEEVAYIDRGESVVVFALVSKTRDGLKKGMDAFKQALGQLKFISREALLKTLIQLGEKDEKAPESQKYQPIAFKKLGPALQQAMQTCTPKKGAVAPYDMVLEVGESGSVDEITVTEKSEVGKCCKGLLTGLTLDPPPFAPYHFHFATSTTP